MSDRLKNIQSQYRNWSKEKYRIRTEAVKIMNEVVEDVGFCKVQFAPTYAYIPAIKERLAITSVCLSGTILMVQDIEDRMFIPEDLEFDDFFKVYESFCKVFTK